MNHANCRRHKNGINKLFDLNRFDEWFEATYQPVNCGNVPIPKVITFKEHIRIMKERDNQYALFMKLNLKTGIFHPCQKMPIKEIRK